MQLSRLRRINPTVIATVLFVIGIILVITAIATDPNHVTCNGQIMNQGDTCVHSFNGIETSRNNLGQQRQSQQSQRILEIIGALLCCGVGVFLFISRYKKARARSKKSLLDTTSQPNDHQQSEVDLPSEGADTQPSGAIPSLHSRDLRQTGTYPSLLTGTHPALPGHDPRQTGTYPSLLTGAHLALPTRDPRQTGTYPSLLTGTHRALPGRDPRQTGSYPSLLTGTYPALSTRDLKQSQTFSPPEGENIQQGTTVPHPKDNWLEDDKGKTIQ